MKKEARQPSTLEILGAIVNAGYVSPPSALSFGGQAIHWMIEGDVCHLGFGTWIHTIFS